jgi:hypothetical protein
VFYYEVLNSPERACNLAKQAFDDAIGKKVAKKKPFDFFLFFFEERF